MPCWPTARYTLAVDIPDDLRCGDVYYGPVTPTRDVYSWDPTTLVGSLESSLESSFDTGKTEINLRETTPNNVMPGLDPFWWTLGQAACAV